MMIFSYSTGLPSSILASISSALIIKRLSTISVPGYR
jgi:hypothetical protein